MKGENKITMGEKLELCKVNLDDISFVEIGDNLMVKISDKNYKLEIDNTILLKITWKEFSTSTDINKTDIAFTDGNGELFNLYKIPSANKIVLQCLTQPSYCKVLELTEHNFCELLSISQWIITDPTFVAYKKKNAVFNGEQLRKNIVQNNITKLLENHQYLQNKLSKTKKHKGVKNGK